MAALEHSSVDRPFFPRFASEECVSEAVAYRRLIRDEPGDSQSRRQTGDDSISERMVNCQGIFADSVGAPPSAVISVPSANQESWTQTSPSLSRNSTSTSAEVILASRGHAYHTRCNSACDRLPTFGSNPWGKASRS